MVMEFHVYTPCIVSLKIAILPNNDMDAGYKQKKISFLSWKRDFIFGLLLATTMKLEYIQIYLCISD